jgi:hypothetical protein
MFAKLPERASLISSASEKVARALQQRADERRSLD